jgi:hypothetical protein
MPLARVLTRAALKVCGRARAQRWEWKSANGLGKPFQRGTITVLSPTEAMFRDQSGHRVLFRLRAGATAFKHLCD